MTATRHDMRQDAVERLGELKKCNVADVWDYDVTTAITGDADANMSDVIDSIMSLLSDDEFMVLPKDAEGNAIHVGDDMQDTLDRLDGTHFTVLGIGSDGYHELLFCEDGDHGYRCHVAGACRHHKNPTVRDIVEELVSKAYAGGWADGSDDMFSLDTEELISEYTERLKGL